MTIYFNEEIQFTVKARAQTTQIPNDFSYYASNLCYFLVTVLESLTKMMRQEGAVQDLP